MNYTIHDLQKEYPNEAACLDKVFKLRYGSLNKVCPSCNKETLFRRIPTRRSYQCRLCYFQIYPCAGTPFEKSRTPLTYWFYAMHLMTTTRNGVSAKELVRALGVTYKCAFRMNKQIRLLMGSKKEDKKLSGIVEVDETYFTKKADRKNDGTPGKTAGTSSSVFGMVERLGQVKATHVKNTTRETLFPIIKGNIASESTVNTDESPVYFNLKEEGYKHEVIKHGLKKYKEGSTSTNTIEGFFAQLKRMITGTHIHVSDKYLDYYVQEAVFRYNHRFKDVDMFGCLMLKITNY